MSELRTAPETAPSRHRRDAALLVAVAAAMWGLDGLLRKPLATALQPGTIVLWEHIVAVVALLPWLPRALRAFHHARIRDRVAIIAIGVGSSAVATALFTKSFALAARSHDFVTPLVLQKLQPLFAIALAVVLLRERPRVRFTWFVVPALAGAWLLTFSDPTHIRVSEVEPALLALAAAALWGAGTVLGRMVGLDIDPLDVTSLRFVFGLIGALVVVWATGDDTVPGWGNVPGLILLGLIPGLIALIIYYRALRRTPASRATIAELAFPVTAAVVGVVFLDSRLTATQWLGLAVVAASIGALSWYERTHHEPQAAALPMQFVAD